MRQTPVPGSLVWLRRRRWRVDRARVDRRTIRLDVSHRHRQLTVLAPYDRPAIVAPDQRVVRVRRQQGLARLAHLIGSAASSRLPAEALKASIDVWPHQLEPVLAVLGGQRRLLIADEVGLGKTIQAGLIVAELLRLDPASRVLVVAPAALRRQWTDELRDRFSIQVRTAEAALGDLDEARHSGAATRRIPGVWLASIDHLKQRHVFDALPLHPWDLVVIDEAHLATGRSDRHEVSDELGRRARHLVLLSATPHDGDASRFNRLLRLGALPERTDSLAVFRRTRADVRLPHGRVVRWRFIRQTPELTHLLDAVEAFEHVLLARVRAAKRDTALLLLSVFRKRALSTMAALDRSLARRLEWLDSAAFSFQLEWLQPALEFDADDLDDDERLSLSGETGFPRATERAWLRRLRTLAATARRREPRLQQLRAYAARTAEPFVLFTEFRHSLEAAAQVVGGVRTVAVVHGGMNEVQRQRELGRFLTGEASALLATDVCSQGLNLQSRARWIVNLELPWNPVRLEQRVGRVDRLGQRRRVHATLLVADHRAESGLLSSLARRTLSARRTLGGAVLDQIGPPSHLAVAASLLGGAALTGLPAVVSPTLPCLTFQRAARAAAVVITRRRALISMWRAPVPAGGRPVQTRCTLRHIHQRRARIIILSIPLTDRTGDMIERRLVAFRLPPEMHHHVDEQLAARLVATIAGTIDARLRRLRRVRGAVATRRLASDQAIALHLHALQYPEEAQLGLFSQREATAFAAARVLAAAANTEAAGRRRLEEDRAVIDSGPPIIDWVGDLR